MTDRERWDALRKWRAGRRWVTLSSPFISLPLWGDGYRAALADMRIEMQRLSRPRKPKKAKR